MAKHFLSGSGRMDLTEGPIFQSLLVFAIPILLGTVVTQLYNVADSMIVGQFAGAEALAAVAAASPAMSITMLFLIGLSSSANVVIAQRVGAHRQEALQNAVDTIAAMTLISAAFITVFGLAICRPLLRLLGTPEEIFHDSWLYLLVIIIGTTGNLVYQMGSGALRGMGDSAWPFLFLLGCSVLNVVLDLAAVLILHWGVPGVAIATALSQFISGVGVIYRINRGGYGVKLSLRTLHIDPVEGKAIISIGLPAAIQNVGNSIAAMCVQSSVNFFGPAMIAANAIVTKVDDLVTIPVMALSTALCTFVGQNMGTRRMDRIKRSINTSILSLTFVGIGLCGILYGFSDDFPRLFSQDREVIALAAQGLRIMCFMCVFFGVDRCLVNAMRGVGKAVVPMITAQFGAFSRIPLAYYLGVVRNDHRGIFTAMLIAAFLRMAAIAVYYYGGSWKRTLAKLEAQQNP